MRALYGLASGMSLIRSSRTLFTLARALPFAVLLAVLGIELSPAHFLYTGPLLSPAPALAAVTMGPAGTGSVIVLAGMLSTITATQNHAWGTPAVYSNLLALFVVSVASLATSTARVHRERELAKARRIAQVSQDVVLRPVPARLKDVRAAGMYLAAEEGARIGGDLYEVVATPFGIRIIVGDVRGKGLPAVRSAAAVLGAFREAADYEPELPNTAIRCEAALRRELTRSEGPEERTDLRDPAEEFVTVIIAQITEAPVVELVSRGHPPPLLLRRGKTTPWKPPAHRRRSVWKNSSAHPPYQPRHTPSNTATDCCSTPTECWRPATPPETSSTCPHTWRDCTIAPPKNCWTGCIHPSSTTQEDVWPTTQQ